MKNISKLLIVFALALVSFGVKAQDITGTVQQNSVHRFFIGTADVASSMYVWTVFEADGKIAVPEGPTTYQFVKGFNDKTAPTDTDSWEVYILFNSSPKDYVVQVQERDKSSECSDDTYNVKTALVTIKKNDFWGKLTWDTGKTAKGETEDTDCALKDPTTGKTTVAFTLTVADDATVKNWNYTYAIGVSDTDDVSTVTWDSPEIVANPVDGTFIVDKQITYSKLVPTGAGYYYLWAKIVKLTDGFGTPVNETFDEGTDKTVLVSRAKLRKIPAGQTIDMD